VLVQKTCARDPAYRPTHYSLTPKRQLTPLSGSSKQEQRHRPSAVCGRLLVVHHTPSPAPYEMFETAVSQARNDEIERVEAVIRPALTAAAADVLRPDGYLLGTPERERPS
jgi:hypothetical protein